MAAALLVDAQEPRRSFEADGLQVQEQRANGGRGRAGGATHRVADADDARIRIHAAYQGLLLVHPARMAQRRRVANEPESGEHTRGVDPHRRAAGE